MRWITSASVTLSSVSASLFHDPPSLAFALLLGLLTAVGIAIVREIMEKGLHVFIKECVSAARVVRVFVFETLDQIAERRVKRLERKEERALAKQRAKDRKQPRLGDPKSPLTPHRAHGSLDTKY